MSKRGTRFRASTFDKLAVVLIEIQSPDPQNSAEHKSLDPTTIRQAKINQFDKHVEILEEQYIDKEIDVPTV